LATTDDARVHYAVLKVRAATSPQTAAHPAPHTARAAHRRGRSAGSRSIQKKHPPHRGGRSLRTQQRARPGPPPATSVPSRKSGRTNQDRPMTRPNNQCSTNERRHPGTLARDAALDTPPRGNPTARASCSLERR
jgi:hypothetical protein